MGLQREIWVSTQDWAIASVLKYFKELYKPWVRNDSQEEQCSKHLCRCLLETEMD